MTINITSICSASTKERHIWSNSPPSPPPLRPPPQFTTRLVPAVGWSREVMEIPLHPHYDKGRAEYKYTDSTHRTISSCSRKCTSTSTYIYSTRLFGHRRIDSFDWTNKSRVLGASSTFTASSLIRWSVKISISSCDSRCISRQLLIIHRAPHAQLNDSPHSSLFA